MAPSRRAWEWTETRLESSEWCTWAPEMTQAPETRLERATPLRISPAWTNFAGGNCSWCVVMGQFAS